MRPVQTAEHPGTAEHLPAFLDFIDNACRGAGVDEDASMALRLAVEEVCLNLIRYGYADASPGPIALEFRVEDDAIRLTVRDRAPPFDPRDAPAPDLTSDVLTRPLGGLGLHLVRCLMDEISYCSDTERGNRLTLLKRSAISGKDD
jgi:anti-sigma regulatory factor (Ser/Thr protein kinase)